MANKELNEEVDRKIKQYFFSKGEKLDTSDFSFSNIESELKKNMRTRNIRSIRVMAIVAAISVIITITAFGKMPSVKYYSYNIQTYKEQDIQNFNEKDINLDFTPNYVMEFNNGYKLSEINIKNTFGINEFNFKCNESTNVEFIYKKGDKKIVLKAHKKDNYNTQKYYFMNYKNSPYYDSSVNDVQVSTWDMERKYVPNGYILNEDDEKFINANMLDIEVGDSDSKVERIFVSKWVMNGVEYCLYNDCDNNDLLGAEVIRMSSDIIEN